nr:amyloid beta A4 precursor protein-binding family B member 1-interacting protein-like isoform X1 [Gorilla gorilla gorilla]
MSQALCQKDKLKGPINGTTQPNGQMPQAADSVSAVLEEAQAHAETWKVKPASSWHTFHPAVPQENCLSSGVPDQPGQQNKGSSLLEIKKLARIRSQPSGTTRSQEHPGPPKAPSPACPTPSGAEVLGHQWQPRHTPQGQGHRQRGLPRPTRLLPAATATNVAPGAPRAPAAAPGLHGDAPGLRAPSPRCRQEASYAPPPPNRHEASMFTSSK